MHFPLFPLEVRTRTPFVFLLNGSRTRPDPRRFQRWKRVCKFAGCKRSSLRRSVSIRHSRKFQGRVPARLDLRYRVTVGTLSSCGVSLRRCASSGNSERSVLVDCKRFALHAVSRNTRTPAKLMGESRASERGGLRRGECYIAFLHDAARESRRCLPLNSAARDIPGPRYNRSLTRKPGGMGSGGEFEFTRARLRSVQ